ncbi:MAG: DUF3857 domain-containing protein, partial [Bacteroidota bacterium]
MYRKSLLSIFLCFFIFPLFAQDLSHEWGSISSAEFKLDTYQDDPDAEALILYDIGNSYFELQADGFEIKFSRKKRIKVLKESGLSYAEVSIPFYVDAKGGREKVSGIQAIVYNEVDGELQKSMLAHDQVFEEKVNENWKQIKFALPNARVGSIIEYQYKVNSPFMYNLPKWKFQDRIPTLYSKYTVNMIPFYEYAFIAQGLEKFDFQDKEVSRQSRKFATIDFQDVTYTFV